MENPIKVIFLDVDGVLNNLQWYMSFCDEHWLIPENATLPDDLLTQLRRIVESTGARIVVSSSWRQIPQLYECLMRELKRFDLEILDKTKNVGDYRGEAIDRWLKDYDGEVSNFVILDDDNDMEPHMDHLVQTLFEEGLTEAKADAAIAMLQK